MVGYCTYKGFVISYTNQKNLDVKGVHKKHYSILESCDLIECNFITLVIKL